MRQDVNETNENEAKHQQQQEKKKKKKKGKRKKKNGFLGLFIGISCLFIRNTLADKAKISGRGVIRAGEGTIRVG